MEQGSKEASLLLIVGCLLENVIVALIEYYKMILWDLNARGHCLIQRVEYNTKIKEWFRVEKSRLCRSLNLKLIRVKVE